MFPKGRTLIQECGTRTLLIVESPTGTLQLEDFEVPPSQEEKISIKSNGRGLGTVHLYWDAQSSCDQTRTVLIART